MRKILNTIYCEYSTLSKSEFDNPQKGFDEEINLLQLSKDEAEKKLLEEVLKQILKREVTDEDEKRLVRVKIDEEKYNLKFDGTIIGRVGFTIHEQEFKSSLNPRFEFIPQKNFQ
jgi:hypothetical protein